MLKKNQGNKLEHRVTSRLNKNEAICILSIYIEYIFNILKIIHNVASSSSRPKHVFTSNGAVSCSSSHQESVSAARYTTEKTAAGAAADITDNEQSYLHPVMASAVMSTALQPPH